jgi:hypothetical protein
MNDPLSAPYSGLKDFFSLKFLNTFTDVEPSLVAYLAHEQMKQKSHTRTTVVGNLGVVLNMEKKFLTYCDGSADQTNSCADP